MGTIKLPNVLKYDLCGLRGCYMTKFPLVIEKKDGKFIGTYCNHLAMYSLACEIGDTEEEVVSRLYNTLKKYKYI